MNEIKSIDDAIKANKKQIAMCNFQQWVIIALAFVLLAVLAVISKVVEFKILSWMTGQ